MTRPLPISTCPAYSVGLNLDCPPFLKMAAIDDVTNIHLQKRPGIGFIDKIE